MTLFIVRLFIFVLFPLLLTWAVIRLDRSVTTRARKLEVLLIFLFGLAVGGSGIANFFAHFFISDTVAATIGWEPGSPFQLEVAFANLAIGILGVIAVGRRDGFREATVIAVTVFSIGATVVHFMDIVATGNLAPGNSLQNLLNIAKPALLIWALAAARRTESAASTDATDVEFDRWRAPLLQSSGPLTGIVCGAYGIGFALDQLWLLTLMGAAAGAGMVMWSLARSPLHEVGWGRQQ